MRMSLDLPPATPRSTPLVLAALLALAQPSFAGDRPRALESGFKIVHHKGCGFGLPELRPRSGPGSRIERGRITDVECGAGGGWGEEIHVAYWFQDVAGDITPVIERRDASGTWTVVRSPGGNRYVTEMSFAPPGWRGDDHLIYTLVPFNPSLPDTIFLARASGSPGWSLPGEDLGSAAADPTGSFGGDLCYGVGGFFATGEIWRQDASGATSLFVSLPAGEMRFGPGGDWGSDLYVSGQTVSPAGAITPFPSAVPFVEFDWAFGPGFDGDMFAVIFRDPQDFLYRIRPDGTTVPFAAGEIAGVAGCGDSLWIVNADGCFEVFKTGN